MKRFLVGWLMIFAMGCFAQQNVHFHFKSALFFPAKYFDAGELNNSNADLTTAIKPKMGYSFGMGVRYLFHKNIHFESGIYLTRRRYDFDISHKIEGKDNGDFTFAGYEIPLMLFFQIPISKKLALEVGSGLGLEMFSSSVGADGKKEKAGLISYRQKILTASLKSSVNVLYDVKNGHKISLGIGVLRPFSNIIGTKFIFTELDGGQKELETFIRGSVFSINLKYYLFSTDKTKR